MKKIISILCCLSFLMTGLVGCSDQAPNAGENNVVENAEPTATPTPDIFARGEKSEILTATLEKLIQDHEGVYSIGIQNLTTGEYVDINPQKLRAASVIKVFVMGAVFDQVNKGKIKLSDKIQLQDREIERVFGTGVLQAKPEGYEISIKTLVSYMIKYSDNRAANILVDMVGRKNINKFIKGLGMKDTNLGYYFFVTPPKGVTNTTSTNDLNAFFKMLYNGTCVSPKHDKQMIEIMKTTENRTKLCANLPEDVVVAHKTGAVTNVEHDAGIIFTDKGDFAISVLTKDVPNSTGTYVNIANIAKVAYTYFTK